MPISPVIGSAAIGAGSSLVSQLLNNSIGARNARRQYEYQLDLMKYQNEYNSPKSQIQRLREAGLNPNLIYGNGQTSVGNMSSADAPKYEPFNPHYDFGSVEQFMGVVMNMKQLEKTEQEIENLKAGRIFTNAQTQQALAHAMNIQLGNYVSRNTLRYQIDAVAADTARTIFEANASRYSPELAQERLASARFDNVMKKVDADLAKSGFDPRATGLIGTVIRLAYSAGLTPSGVVDYVKGMLEGSNGLELSSSQQEAISSAVDNFFNSKGDFVKWIYERSKKPSTPGRGFFWLFPRK